MKELFNTFNDNPISEVQYYLREISKYNQEIPLINPDGIYDSKTRESLALFQKTCNLPQTGVVDLITWNTLVNQYNKYKSIDEIPNKLECFPSKACEIKRGDECDTVYILQIIINRLNRKYKNYNKVNVTGIYDIETENEIMKFQATNKIPVTGKVDKATWNSISAINNTCKLYE